MPFGEELLDEFILCGISFLEITLAQSFGGSESNRHSILISHFCIQIIKDLGVKCCLLFLFRLC